jgi:hypothetical protein
MDITKLLEKSKPLMKARFHPGKWSSKCKNFYEVFKTITERCYPVETILNIGVGPQLQAKSWNRFLRQLWPSVEDFHNLEISEAAAAKARKHKNELINQVTVGDAKKLDLYFRQNEFDLIFWNQGPEHIYRKEWEDCFRRLDYVATKAVYIHVPWGSGYDGDIYHYSKSIRKGELEEHGFTCHYHGVEDSRDGGIMGYKLL